MRIGRFSFGIIMYLSHWGYVRPPCDCHILSLGRIYLIWSGKTCKCNLCGMYDCQCICPLCSLNYLKCKCEKFV
jgi:hypothetical protein